IPTTNGDFLRGRLVSLDENKMVVEIRLENVEIPRDRIAQIICLHREERAETPTTSPAQTDPSSKLRVQALRSDGMRMTFFPEQFAEQTLSGTSEILGKCKSDVLQLEQLLIGGTIEVAAADLVYHKWRLHR